MYRRVSSEFTLAMKAYLEYSLGIVTIYNEFEKIFDTLFILN